MSGSSNGKDNSPLPASQDMDPHVSLNAEVAEELVWDTQTGRLIFRPMIRDGSSQGQRTPNPGPSTFHSFPTQSSAAQVLVPAQYSVQTNLHSIGSSVVPSLTMGFQSSVESQASVYPTLRREFGQTELSMEESETLHLVDPTLGVDIADFTSQTSDGHFQNPPPRQSYRRRSSRTLPGPRDSEGVRDSEPYANEIPLIPIDPQGTSSAIGVPAAPRLSLRDMLRELRAEFNQVRSSLLGATEQLTKYLDDHQNKDH